MKRWQSLILLSLGMVLSLGFRSIDVIGPCTGEHVNGTVMSIDPETRQVIIRQDDGTLCQVNLDLEFDHPIINLLGDYFGQISTDALIEALENLTVPLVCDEGFTTCEIVADGESDLSAQVIAVQIGEGGTTTLELIVDGFDGSILLELGTEEAQQYQDALALLEVDWQLVEDQDGNGFVGDVGSEIADLHAEGIGFGVLVKIYAIAAEAREACAALEQEGDGSTDSEFGPTEEVDPCSLDTATLIDAFRSGQGMGQIFKVYGKPGLNGVGHVRQQTQDGEQELEPEAGEGDAESSSHGICNARAHGGKANAKGKGEVVCP